MKSEHTNSKKLTKIQNLITALTNVDNQILAIQSLAKELSEGKHVCINLNAILEKQNSSKVKVSKDSSITIELGTPARVNGYGLLGGLFGFAPPDEGDVPKKQSKAHDKIEVEISEVISLRVLALVLEEKLALKAKIVSRLTKAGVA